MLKPNQALREKVIEVVAASRRAGKIPNLRYSDLAGADLAGADLAGADFWGADLDKVNFEHANLEGTVFCRANLGWTIFYRTHMKGANLMRANLVGAEIIRCTLTNADFSEVDLSATIMESNDMAGAKLFDTLFRKPNSVDDLFRKTNLSDSNLEGAEYSPKTRWPDGFDYEAATRRGGEDGLTMYHVVFSDGVVIGQELAIDQETDSGGPSVAAFMAHAYRCRKFPDTTFVPISVKNTNTGQRYCGDTDTGGWYEVSDTAPPSQAAKSPQKPVVVSTTGTRRYSVVFDPDLGGVRDIVANAPVDAAVLGHAEAIKDGFHVTPPGWCNVRDLQTDTVYGVMLDNHTSIIIEGDEYPPDTVWPDGFDYEAAVAVEEEEGRTLPFEVCFSDGVVLVVMAHSKVQAANIARNKSGDADIVRVDGLTAEELKEKPAGFYTRSVDSRGDFRYVSRNE